MTTAPRIADEGSVIPPVPREAAGIGSDAPVVRRIVHLKTIPTLWAWARQGAVVAKFSIKFSVSILICVLSLSVAFSEYSELTHLRDDTSNDFSFQGCASPSEAAHTVVSIGPSMQPFEIAIRTDHPEWNVYQLHPVTTPRAGSDLLHLLSIQRT